MKEQNDTDFQEIIITVGISGCGKSTLYKKKYPDYVLLEADEIRRELLGDVSDQSQEEKVWSVYYDRLEEHLKNKDNLYLSATHLNTWSILRDLDFIKQFTDNDKVRVKILLFTVSENPKVCFKRVEDDLSNGIDRSKTINVKAKDGEELIYSMSNKYKKLINSDKFYKLIDLGIHPHNKKKNIHLFMYKVNSFPVLEQLKCSTLCEKYGCMVPEVNGYAIIKKNERNKFLKVLQDKFELIDSYNK